MAGRPDWVKCVLLGAEDDEGRPVRETWCGRVPSPGWEWLFQDPSHAALNGRRGGRIVACEGCARAIARALGLTLSPSGPEGPPRP